MRLRSWVTAAVGVVALVSALALGVLALRASSEATRSAIAIAAQCLAAAATLATVIVASISASRSAQAARDSELTAERALHALAGHRDMSGVLAVVANARAKENFMQEWDSMEPDPEVVLLFRSRDFAVHNLRAWYEGDHVALESPKIEFLPPDQERRMVVARRVDGAKNQGRVLVEFDDPDYGTRRSATLTLASAVNGQTSAQRWIIDSVTSPRLGRHLG